MDEETGVFGWGDGIRAGAVERRPDEDRRFEDGEQAAFGREGPVEERWSVDERPDENQGFEDGEPKVFRQEDRMRMEMPVDERPHKDRWYERIGDHTANNFGIMYSRKRISQNSFPNSIYIFPKSFMIFSQELRNPKRNYENQI